jgi:hypothetical protein
MEQKELSQLSDGELLEAAKKMKSTAIMNAFLIGFLAGVVIFSIVKSTWGMLTLIPLYFIYKLVNKGKDDEGLKKILKERNLK